MITTRRSNGLQTESTRGGVDLLEREERGYDVSDSQRIESMEEAKARMQRNLDRLLNYDRYSELEAEKVAESESVVNAQTAVREAAYSDEDIRPTTTTTQFIDGDPQIFNDAAKNKEANSGYRLNGKGKLVIALYTLVVAVILALIVINTGVLKALISDVNQLNSVYESQIYAINEQRAVIDEVSSAEHIIEIAESELGMILR